MATPSQQAKKSIDSKNFNFVSLTKVLENLNPNEPFMLRKNTLESQTQSKVNKSDIGDNIFKFGNEKFPPREPNKAKFTLVLLSKAETEKQRNRKNLLKLKYYPAVKEKNTSQIASLEDCQQKSSAKNIEISNKRDNRSSSLIPLRGSNPNIHEKETMKPAYGTSSHQQSSGPVLRDDLKKISSVQNSQYSHINKLLSISEEELSKDEYSFRSATISKRTKKPLEVAIPEASKSQTLLAQFNSSKHFPQTCENQTTNASLSPKLKNELNATETSFVWKEKAKLRKIVDVQVQKSISNISQNDIQTIFREPRAIKGRKTSITDPEKENEFSTNKLPRKLERGITDGMYLQELQRENVMFAPDNDRGDNLIGIRAPYQIRDRNYHFALRLESYMEFLNKVNFSNMLFVAQLQRARPQTYKYHVKKGNNHLLIKNAFIQRWWWQPVEIGDGKSYENINFLWSPWRINDFVNALKKHDFDQLSTNKDELLLETPVSLPNDLTERDRYDDPCTKWAKSKILEERQGRDVVTSIDPKLYANLTRIYSSLDIKNLALQEQFCGVLTNRMDRRNLYFIEEWKKTTNNNSKYQFARLTETLPNKMYNHLENNFLLSNKKALFLNLRQYYLSQKMDPFEFIPLTFHIRTGLEDPEFARFKEYYSEKQQDLTEKNIWIVKPGENTNRGTGITICENIEEIEQILTEDTLQYNGKPKTFIVQKYIEKPLLYQRRKFDIRCYILITSINGIQKGYWYQDGYIRTSSSEFTLENLANKQVHLTNDAVQKKCEEYSKHETGNKIAYAELQKFLDTTIPEKKINFMGNIYPQLKKLALDAIGSVFGRLDPYRREFSFELFGLDFMIDENLKPFLIEINTNPCLELSSPLLAKIIPTMIENLFRLVIDPLFPPPLEWPSSRRGWAPENCLESNKFELIFDERGADIPKFGLNTANQHLGQIIDECEEDIDNELME